MKKLILLLVLVFACLFTVTACGDDEDQGGNETPVETPTPEITEEDLNNAVSFVKQYYMNESSATPKTYELLAGVPGGATVTWSIAVTAGDQNGIKILPEKNADGYWVVEIGAEPVADIEYTLTATISIGELSGTIVYERVVPGFKVNSYDEYATAEKEAPLVVEGIVSSILSKKHYGDAANIVFLHTPQGGYYVYNLTEDPVDQGIKVGQTVRASGVFDNYNGTFELINADLEIIDATIKTITPEDWTEEFLAAEKLSDKSLTYAQAHLVTLKGITITDFEEENGYYNFELGGKKAYIRISSSNCPLNAADTETFISEFKAHSGYIANITGLVSIYSGNFYLQPVTVDAIEYLSLPTKTDAEAVADEAAALKFAHTKFTENTVIELPLEVGNFGVAVAWTSNNVEAAAIDANGKLTITQGEEDVTVTLTATLSKGEASEDVEFTFTVLAESKGIFIAKPITAPVAGSFVVTMDLTATGQGVRYFDGTINDKGAFNTTDAIAAAAQVEVEAVEGGYALKVGDKYVEGYLNGTYKNMRLVDTKAVWVWNEDIKTFTCDIEGTKYYFGDRDRGGYANTTMALSDIKYVTGENLSKVGISQFVGQFCTLAPAAYKPVAIESPVAGSFVVTMDLTATGQGVRYFDGTINDKGAFNTTDKVELAAKVEVEAVEGGYALKVGDKYVEGYLNGTYKNMRLVDTKAVWVWNEDIKTFTCDIEGTKYYFGDRDRGGYANTTMALSDIKYVTGENLSKVGISQFVGQFCNLVPAEIGPVATTAPVAGSFVVTMDLTATGQGVRYFDGTINDKGAFNTTDKMELAAQVEVEAVEGGYALKVGDKYVEGYLNGTYKNMRLVDTKAVWVWNEDIKTFTCDIEGTKYYFGDRDRGGYANTTMALSDIKYVTGENLSKVGISQFVGQFCVIGFVGQTGLTDEQKVTLDKNALKVESNTTKDIVLPTKGEKGSTITWTSSNEAVISAAGKVVRPAAGEANATVTLTATIVSGDVTQTATFTVTVPAEVELSGETVEVTYDFVTNFATYAKSWGTGYEAKSFNFADLGATYNATITLSRGNKQKSGNAIDDRPVLATKASTEYLTVEITDGNIQAVTFNFKQWTTKTFNGIVVEYFDGTNWVACSSSITNPSVGTLSSTAIPAGVTKVRLSVNGAKSDNVQLGLTSVVLTIA